MFPVPASVLLWLTNVLLVMEPWICNTPPLILVLPVYVLAPVSSSVPVPILFNEPPVPPFTPPSWIMPEKVVLRLLLPTVRLLAPKKTFPSPSTEPTVTPRISWNLLLWRLMSKLPLPNTSIRDVPPVELSSKRIVPPWPPPNPPFAISVAESAVGVPMKKRVMPPNTPLTVPPSLMIVALPADGLPSKPSKSVVPPNAPLTVPPWLMIVALPAVGAWKKSVSPPNAPLTVAPLLVIVAWLAVEVPKKFVSPPGLKPLTVPPWLMIVALPAVELPLNSVPP